jgi:hypothetical protein
MKKRNKKKNSCAITNLWSSLEKMKKAIFIDLDKQEVTNVLTGNKLSPFLTGGNRKKEQKHYAITYCFNGKKYNLLLHRLFFYWHHEYLPSLVDHKDTNPQNNNIKNLRALTKSENTRNSHKKNKKKTSSKYKGVSWSKCLKKWEVRLCLNLKSINLGYYINEDDAGQAYNDAIRKYGLEEVSILNDTPQERARENIQFDPLPPEMNHLKDLFKNLEPLVDFK